jgi:hypothetical protein
MFKIHGEAREYCEKFGLKVAPLDVFEAAEALHRAFVAGQEAAQQSVQPTCPKAEALRNAEALEDIARQLDESR